MTQGLISLRLIESSILKKFTTKLTQFITLICFTWFQLTIPYQLALANPIPNQVNNINNLPITPDGTTNTIIDHAANNVPIVNIAAPNAGGLSHNRFQDYNVNQQGLILNNATNNPNAVILTQIGGLINDDPHLRNSGSAAIILNEVTSNNISHLSGYSEIAGKKADLILANPNGFVMNGA